MERITIGDALSIFDSVKDRVKAVTKRPNLYSDLDYTYITPTLLAVGKLGDDNVGELTSLVQGHLATVWNLSGKPLSARAKTSLNNRVIDAPWITPGQFTHLPTLSCAHSLCYSVKSWLDLNNDNIAVIHCANGKSRSGVLIACLLRFIKAFSSSSEAFDYFTKTRLDTSVAPVLAPSYRQFFRNIDETMAKNAISVQSKQIVLKSMTIGGLPVDDKPCVEVLTADGVIFSSYPSSQTNNSGKRDSVWSSEFGDGKFRIEQELIGDFSIICRFGGHHLRIRDHTTLIFKYQHNTAYISGEVELTRETLDVNPQYADSLDFDLFFVNLVFGNSVGQSFNDTSSYHQPGKAAFDAGLDELSKHANLLPDVVKSNELVRRGYSPQYVPVALQLSNNSVDLASQLLDQMNERALDLDDNRSNDVSPTNRRASDPGLTRNHSHETINFETNTGARGGFTGNSVRSPMNQSDGPQYSLPKPSLPLTPPENSVCAICNDGNPSKADQLIPCSGECNHYYHTFCIGARRVPYSMNTEAAAQVREKYVLKHFGFWRCNNCPAPSSSTVNPIPSPRHSLLKRDSTIHNVLLGKRSSVSEASSLNLTALKNSGYGAARSQSKLPTPMTSHDQIAILLGILSSSGITVESLLTMSEEQQRETLIKATKNRNKSIKSARGVNEGDSDSEDDPYDSHYGQNAIPRAGNVQGMISYEGQGLGTELNRGYNFEPGQGLSTGSGSELNYIKGSFNGLDQNKGVGIDSGYNQGTGSGNSNGLGLGQGSGSGQGSGNGYGLGPGMGPGHGPGPGPGQGAGNGYGLGPGMGPGQGAGNGYGLGPGMGPGQGAGNGYGLGPGMGPGQGAGNGYGLGPGMGPGQGNGNGYGLGPGMGPGQGAGNGNGLGLGQGSSSGQGNGYGYGLGPGMGPGQGPGSGQGTGNGYGLGLGQGSSSGQGNGYGYGLGPGMGSGQGSDLGIGIGGRVENRSFFPSNPRPTSAAFPGGNGIRSNLFNDKIRSTSLIGSDPRNKILFNEVNPNNRHLNNSAGSEASHYRRSFVQPGKIAGFGKEISSSGSNNTREGLGNGKNARSSMYSKLSTGQSDSSLDNSVRGYNNFISPQNKSININAGFSSHAESSSSNMYGPGGNSYGFASGTNNYGAEFAGLGNKSGKSNNYGSPGLMSPTSSFRHSFRRLSTAQGNLDTSAGDDEDGDEDDDGVFSLAVPLATKQKVMALLSRRGAKEKVTVDKAESLKMRDDPKFGKYVNLVEMGMQKAQVAQKMVADGVVVSVEAAQKLLDLGPDGIVPGREGEKKEADEKKKKEEEEKKQEEKKEEKPIDEADKGKVAIKNHPKYEKYFKMLKVGLPKEAVKAKMIQEGVDPSKIDIDPDTKVPLDEDGEKIALKDHPTYAKYFKMLKVGLPKEAVKAKMTQEGVDPSKLDLDPEMLVPINDKKGEMVAAQDHPKYAKYFKMLKVGLPKDAIKAKMIQEKVNPDIIDKDPTELILLDESGNIKKVAAKDHPKYAKYFKMLKVGLPKESVKAKMKQEGVNPDMLDKDPDELIPEDEEAAAAAAPPKLSFKINKGDLELKKKSTVRKKKLFWKALDASKITSDSLWFDQDQDIDLDEAEFNELFVNDTKAEDAKKKKPVVSQKKQKICLIDMKRGQNAGIALARIKIPFTDLKTKTLNMDDSDLTIEQLQNLQEYLPTQEEIKKLKDFHGDPELLGAAEKYMMVFMDLPSASNRMECMKYKQQFLARFFDLKQTAKKILDACEEVKSSVRLKRVLKTILKVGNQMNEGDKNIGFSLESLLKLQSQKAFDNKTTILDYVINLVYRNDRTALDFPQELQSCESAARLHLDSVQTERAALRKGMDDCLRILAKLNEEDAKAATIATLDTSKPVDGVSAVETTQARLPSARIGDFFDKAKMLLSDLDKIIDERVKSKYSSLLTYFGEDPGLPSCEFFFTLSKFTKEFATARDAVERAKKAEEKRKNVQAKQEIADAMKKVKILAKATANMQKSTEKEISTPSSTTAPPTPSNSDAVNPTQPELLS